MTTPAPSDPHADAYRHLSAADARLAAVIERAGPCRFAYRSSGGLRQDELFAALVESIVSQQLSPKAAETIFGRVRALVDGPFAPSAVLALPEESLRGAGLSGAKTRGVRDLATRVHGRTLDLEALHAMEDEAVVESLSAVRGIGRWTAEMVLIFQLGRLDVLPVGDLGVRKGFQRLFGLRELPKPERMEKLARPFQPYRSIASWYMWRVTEQPVAKKTATKAVAKTTAGKKTVGKKTVTKKAAPKKAKRGRSLERGQVLARAKSRVARG